MHCTTRCTCKWEATGWIFCSSIDWTMRVKAARINWLTYSSETGLSLKLALSKAERTSNNGFASCTPLVIVLYSRISKTVTSKNKSDSTVSLDGLKTKQTVRYDHIISSIHICSALTLLCVASW